MGLPSIDFAAITETAKAALVAYGTPTDFIEQGQTTGRTVRTVIYRDGATIEKLINDADTSVANAILNPDEFQSPYRMPQKFDKLRVSVGGFTRTYTIDAPPAPILAADSLPLILAQVRAN